HDDYFGNASGASTGGGCPGAGSITADPLYVDPAGGNFNLQCTPVLSPAVDAGVNLGVDQPDLNGASPGLWNGGAPDMGAYESSCGATLALVKQVWDSVGVNCLASIPADATCN